MAFFSTSPDACALASTLQLQQVTQLSDNPDQQQLQDMRSLLTDVDSAKKQLVFVHVTTSPSLWAQAFVADLLVARERGCLINVIQRCAAPESRPVHPLRPRQSVDKVKGKYPETDAQTQQHLLLAFHETDSTRQDAVWAFDAQQAAVKGGYGSMNARVLLAELAFRLGCAPKYGA